MRMHYLCWFSTGSVAENAFVPADGGCEHEMDEAAWELNEILRDECGIHLEAFVPVLQEMKDVSLDRLPSPQRCMEVFSDHLVATLRETSPYKIKDIFKQPKEIAGSTIADMLESYRKRWVQGFHLIRLPDPGSR